MPPLQQILDFAVPVITFLLMITVGLDLTREDFQRVHRSPRALIVGTVGQYCLPLIAFLVLRWIHPTPEIVGGMILIASSPAGGISNFYSYLARANVALSVVLTALSCLMAPLTMPFLIKGFEFALGKRIDFQVPLKLLFGQLLLLIVLPIWIGLILRRRRPDLVSRFEKRFRAIGMFGLACLIGFILFETKDLFLLNWYAITRAAGMFVVFSMIAGYLVSFLFRLTGKDRFTITIEFGVRNIAIATTAAVVILKRTEFATFAATYFLIEAILILSIIWAVKAFQVRRRTTV